MQQKGETDAPHRAGEEFLLNSGLDGAGRGCGGG